MVLKRQLGQKCKANKSCRHDCFGKSQKSNLFSLLKGGSPCAQRDKVTIQLLSASLYIVADPPQFFTFQGLQNLFISFTKTQHQRAFSHHAWLNSLNMSQYLKGLFVVCSWVTHKPITKQQNFYLPVTRTLSSMEYNGAD